MKTLIGTVDWGGRFSWRERRLEKAVQARCASQAVVALEPGGKWVEQEQVGGCEGWLRAGGEHWRQEEGSISITAGTAGVSGGILRWRTA